MKPAMQVIVIDNASIIATSGDTILFNGDGIEGDGYGPAQSRGDWGYFED